VKTYSFTVVLAGIPSLSDEIIERLFAAGCDDCTPLSGDGVTKAMFDRQAGSLESAITSATAEIRSAGFDVGQFTIETEDLAALAGAKP
jgi:hypothetical protein